MDRDELNEYLDAVCERLQDDYRRELLETLWANNLGYPEYPDYSN